MFYPAQPEVLRQQIRDFLAAARIPTLPGPVRAVIAPHAGYIYSGPVAGYSFRALPDLSERTIYLLGPAHFVPVRGVAAGTFRAMRTPLGEAPVAVDVVADLIAAGEPFHYDDEAHAPEHSLEVEVPFLQALGDGRFRLVPLLFGTVDPDRVAAILAHRLAAEATALVVVSSDLSHYHPYETARRLDTAFLQAVVRGDTAAVGRGEACGLLPILTLMLVAEHLGWQPHWLDYRNSGDTAGDRQRVVGYGAVAYTERAEM
jgi:AmmeMemoRadiSam system protein B